MKWILALLFSANLSLAFADGEAYHVAFSEGRYSEAVELAEVATTPERLAFSARSLLAEAMSAPDYAPPAQLLDAAEAKARRALEIDPKHVEGRLQLAIALSLKARPLSNREGMRTGYGSEAKKLADAVLEDDPENSYAHGFLAVWHLEVRRRGGSIGASVMGASVRKGRTHYEEAIRLAPDDASIHWQYARALAALNAKKYNQEATQVLRKALDCGSDSELEGVMKDRATLLLATLQNESRKTAERLAEQML